MNCEGLEALDKESLIRRVLAQAEMIAALTRQVEVLTAANAGLTARVAELEAKLGLPLKTPDNSSLPPSKGQKPSAPAAPKPKAKPHAGSHRPLHPHPTSRRELRAERCQSCGADVSQTAQFACESYDHVEIPPIEPEVTRVTLLGGVCPCCGKRFKAKAPADLAPGSPFGDNLRAFVIYLRSVQGIALARLVVLLRDLFGLTISEGALVNILDDSRPAFVAQTSLIKARLLMGTALASDETGVRVGNANWWLWVFHHADNALFVIDPHRSKEVVETFLGEWRPDFWLSDRLGSQMGWAQRGHQVCLAHLIRDVQYAIDAGDAIFAPGMKGLLKRACAIGRRRDRLSDSTLKVYEADLERRTRSPARADARHAGRTQDAARHQEGPPASVCLHRPPRDRADQQRLGARPAPLRRLPQNHQRFSQPLGRRALRRHPLRRRNRPTTLAARPRRHPPHTRGKTPPYRSLSVKR